VVRKWPYKKATMPNLSRMVGVAKAATGQLSCQPGWKSSMRKRMTASLDK